MDSEYSQEYNTDRKMILVKCNVCEKWCDTLEQFNIHKNSTKHMKKAERLQCVVNNTPSLMRGDNLQSINLKCDSISSSLVTDNRNEADSECSREYNPERRMMLIKCKVCKIWIDTMNQFLLHQKSPKHAAKRDKLQHLSTHTQLLLTRGSSQSGISSSVSSGFSCQVCDISCNTKEQLSTHFAGKSHKSKSLKYEYKDWESAEIPLFECSSKRDVITPISDALPVFSTNKDEVLSLSVQPPSGNLSAIEIKKLLTPERSTNCVKCVLCNMFTDTEEQYFMHCNGTKHTKRMKTLNIQVPNLCENMNKMSIIDGEMKFCEVCKIKININNMESHEKGKTHKEKLVKMSHQSNSFDNCPMKRKLSPTSEHFKSMKLVPRDYQTEVYEKGLNSDSVIFLPTGTGKTLVAAMLIIRMLEENPQHRVAFLVDKVLLVMQQHDFFETQLKNISMKRFDKDGETNRTLRLIGLASNHINTEHTINVRDHDVVVATAELFRGLLAKKNLFWDEFGLVILDEAHHCVKDHPYNKLLREYHLYPEFVLVDKTDVHVQCQQGGVPKVFQDKLQEWKQRRCKMIGLTASPAGNIDKEMTHTLLLALLESLGGVDIVNVTENKEELDMYTSNSDIEAKLIGYDKEETELRDMLKSAFFFMVGKFERLIMLNKSLTETKDCRNLSIEDVAEFKNQLKARLLETESIQKSTINHVMGILDIIDAVDTFGYGVGWQRLKDLMDNENEKVWLEDNIIQFVPKTESIISQKRQENSTVIQAIIDEAKSDKGEPRTILVLVRERETAHEFEKILKRYCLNQELVLLVGHGASSGKDKKDNKGMNVKKQKKALNLIKGRNNQIIVATSVADEGIDLPDCDLVILINPPSSVQALVQVRGRARKKSSRLLMICRDQHCIDELKLLQLKEKNIIESIEKILSDNRKV